MTKFLEYLPIRILYELLRLIPLKISKILACFLALILQYVIKYRRNVIENNLKNAFPEYRTDQIKSILNQAYKNFFILWIEILQNWRLNKEFIEKNIVPNNWEVVERAKREGKGLILLTGHLGNFEWFGHYIAIKLGTFYAIQKRIKNPYVNNFIVRIRERYGMKLIYTDEAMKKCLSVLKKNKIVGIVGDQDFGRRGIFVNFFNKPASTAVGPAVLHLRTKSPLIMCISIRKDIGKFDYYFERIPDVNSNEINEETIYTITQIHTSILEKWIRKYPEQWLWTHRRWMTKPDVSQNKYL
jgi:KDO2-lipid IV(A) lauroyltransferase